MKNYKLILVAVLASCAFSACSGDHGVSGGSDSVQNNMAGAPSNIDTSTVTHATGESGVVANDASGGVLIAKDTTHIKVRSVPVAAAAPATAAPAKDTTAAVKK